jgi:putative ATP-binding cassette transporter
MEFLRTLLRDSGLKPAMLLSLTLIASLATVIVIGAVTAAAQVAANGESAPRLLAVFLVSCALYAGAQLALMRRFASALEVVIHGIRSRLVERIRAAEYATIREIGREPLFAAITRHTQTISRNLPLAVLGVQQLVLVVFVCLYLATLSTLAFSLAAIFSAAIVITHLARMKRFGARADEVADDESRLFRHFDGLLHGQKEARLSARRAEGQVRELALLSGRARDARSGLKRAWAREFALVELGFYGLVGVMVFVVPGLSDGFHSVAFPAIMAALFLIGPVAAVATAIPAMEEAERALRAIRQVERQLVTRMESEETAPKPAGSEGLAQSASASLGRLELEAVRYAYPGEGGAAGFSVGPLSARFEAGQITFITGGNGAGKSTMLLLLTGLLAPAAGCLRVDGAPVDAQGLQSWRDRIGAVFADYHLFSRLYGLASYSPQRLTELLERFEMADKVSVQDGAFSTRDLSSGQRKRLALIATLLEDRPVLVLDEWAADQDPHFRAVFYEQLLPALREQGKLIICVTHDDRWFHVADQILRMHEGRLEAA